MFFYNALFFVSIPAFQFVTLHLVSVLVFLLLAMQPDVEATIDSLLKEGQCNPATTWNSIYEVLKENKLAWVQKIHVELMLVHPENRARTGINPHNAHKTGALILSMGADLAELGKSTCVEVSGKADIHDGQLKFNQQLVEASGELLAPVSCMERFLSVSSSHTAAFCRAVLHGCKTPNSSLDGKLNKAQYMCDAQFKLMLEDGWSWRVISSIASERFPELPGFAAKALNASHNVTSTVTELEVALRMTTHTEIEVGMPANWGYIMRDSTSDHPSCKSYVRSIAEWVRVHGGGRGFPLVLFLGKFGKMFAENRLLGCEYWTAVTFCNFNSNDNMYSFIRLAGFKCFEVNVYACVYKEVYIML